MSKAIQFRNRNNELIYPCPYYPVGSIYLSMNDINPGTIFGGTWEMIKDRFLLGAGGSYTSGSTGGEKTHKLTVAEMPSHTHNYKLAYGVNDPAKGFNYGTNLAGTFSEDFSQAAGGNQAHNNMPPYIAVYMWKRVS